MEENKSSLTDDFDNLPEVRIEPDFMEKVKPAKHYLDTFYNELGDGTKTLLGFKTGIDKLDDHILGLRGLIVLAGAPGAGKTSFALQLAFGACKHLTPVIFYSLEQTRKQILSIILSQESGISYRDILLKGKALIDDNIGDFTPGEREVLKTSKESVEKKLDNFYIRSYEEDQPDISLAVLRDEIKGIQTLCGKEVLVIIDQIQDLELGGGDEYRDQIDKEGQIIRGLTKIVNETGACILGVSHLNKEAMKKGGANMSGVKGSVDLIYKPESVWQIYLEDEENSGGDIKGIVLDIVKARDYALGKKTFTYYGKTRKFDIK
jgi:replicative DNA helicase